MMNASPPRSSPNHPHDLLFSVLENTEFGVAVVDASGRAVYMNSSARHLLAAPSGVLPPWADEQLAVMLERLTRASTALERWVHDELVLRVRARPLNHFTGLVVLEILVAHAAGGREIAEQLASSLQLTISDAKLLALLWRGMSNDEIAERLGVRVGTVKSRLFRLYQKLGVNRRPAAVLRAAEVLAT